MCVFICCLPVPHNKILFKVKLMRHANTVDRHTSQLCSCLSECLYMNCTTHMVPAINNNTDYEVQRIEDKPIGASEQKKGGKMGYLKCDIHIHFVNTKSL